jgi:hypothetical protein
MGKKDKGRKQINRTERKKERIMRRKESRLGMGGGKFSALVQINLGAHHNEYRVFFSRG